MDIVDPLGLFHGGSDIDTTAVTMAYEEARKAIQEHSKNAKDYLEAVDTKRKSAKELAREGREIAGAAAVDKAGIAKKQAKAASTMAGASKLFSAIQGAQAATDAVTKGFDEASQAGAQLAAGQENAEKGAEMAKAQSQANVEANAGAQEANAAMNYGNATLTAATNKAQMEQQEKENRKNRMAQLGSAFIS